MPALDPSERAAWREANRGFIARAYPLARTRFELEKHLALDRDRWSEACDMGWISVLIGSEHGGLGAGPELFAELCEELARGLVGDPVVGCALSASVIADDPSLAGGPLLARLLDGSATCAWCVAESDDDWGPADITLELSERGDGLALTGSKRYVLGADVADQLLVTVSHGGSRRNVIVAAATSGVTVTRARGLDLTRSVCRVDFRDVPVVVPAEWDPAAAERALRRGLALGAVAVSADAIGAATHLMEATVAYTLQREVFGRMLATYQAVKHRCADMLCGIEGSREALADAARRVDGPATEEAAGLEAAERAVHVLKSFADERCSWIAGEALQLHGGIGFTWEHDLHLYLRRIKADGALFGSVASHRDALGLLAIEDADSRA